MMINLMYFIAEFFPRHQNKLPVFYLKWIITFFYISRSLVTFQTKKYTFNLFHIQLTEYYLNSQRKKNEINLSKTIIFWIKIV